MVGNFAVPDAGEMIFDNMVGLVDGILKFISSELFRQFWEWMDNAI